ncbi:SGNH/GDSL hydrolase family protein [Pedobacter fastidiosus]|uniref:SGNH/GDSL hydrolase family protein n=1 Tax=Pedobacter fastidiosus TaxID=2765361 RepID=A0ABR7KRG0_9SPHI|nr:GDSL-type esterase/lipase family protein [Pedobacter fastidiosus]MBC6110682.1 SGNH/GDSL hydrolase family protein [Pedobacter fastidiosus]
MKNILALILFLFPFCLCAQKTDLWVGDSQLQPTGPDFAQACFVRYSAVKYGRNFARFYQSGRTVQALDNNYPSTNSIEYAGEHNGLTTLSIQGDAWYAYVPQFNKVFVEAIVNDALSKTNAQNPVSVFKAKYKVVIIEKLLSLGWAKKDIKLINCPPVDASVSAYVKASPERIGALNVALSELGTEYGIQVIDINTPMNAINNFFADYTVDGLHGNALWHQLVADQIDLQITASESQGISSGLPRGKRFVIAPPLVTQ